MIFSLLILAWVFYEASGGADFVPPSKRASNALPEARPAATTPAESSEPASATPEPAPREEPATTIRFASMDLEPPAEETPEPQPDLAALNTPLPAPEEAPASGSEGLFSLTTTPEQPAAQDQLFSLTSLPDEDTASAPEPEPAWERRKVRTSRANMREGPGTSNAVVETLDGGQIVEVLEESGSWVRLRVPETGAEGWMSGRLLLATE